MNLRNVLSVLLFQLALLSPAVLVAQDFSGVKWKRDEDNTPKQDKMGSGKNPSTKDATNNQGEYTFEITTTKGGKQRQEWKYERRQGYTGMELKFRINSTYKAFDQVGIVQCHDDQTGSEGVFSIYQIRKSRGKYFFGVQGDTTEAQNQYRKFKPVEIKLDQWYKLKLRTNTQGKTNSFERAQLLLEGKKIYDNVIKGGGDKESYYKIGAYRLNSGSGKMSVTFNNIKFYTGKK